MTNIKKCPFCGYTKTRIEDWNVVVGRESHNEYAVVCENCGAFGPNDLGKSGAIEAWNMRREFYPGDEPKTEDDDRPFPWRVCTWD